MKEMKFGTLAIFLAVMFTFCFAYDELETRVGRMDTAVAEEREAGPEPEQAMEPEPVPEPEPEPEPEVQAAAEPVPEEEPAETPEPAHPPVTLQTGVTSTDRFRPDIPLTREEQKALQCACQEFDVPYSLTLGIIQKETGFENRIGDSGRSVGYMQIQPRWWEDLMNEIGATDLMIPEDNFRTGCAILRRLIDEANGSIPSALTVYNVGHDNGSRDYARAVMALAEGWE